jgi:hypothetical protein
MSFSIGDLVIVGPPYVGDGHYHHDGHSGLHTVVGSMGDGHFYLVKGNFRHDPRRTLWDVVISESRMERAFDTGAATEPKSTVFVPEALDYDAF